MKHLTVICDIVNSRSLAQRGEVQEALAKALAKVNKRSGKRIESPYTITLGDEFQVVYSNADSLFPDFISILEQIAPVELRLAIGIGRLDTPINRKQAIGMDGPAFHRSREAMTHLKASGDSLCIVGEGDWGLANHALGLLGHEMKGWERNRLNIFSELLQGREVKEFESRMAISRTAIYKNIRAGALEHALGLCHEVSRALNAALTTP